MWIIILISNKKQQGMWKIISKITQASYNRWCLLICWYWLKDISPEKGHYARSLKTKYCFFLGGGWGWCCLFMLFCCICRCFLLFFVVVFCTVFLGCFGVCLLFVSLCFFCGGGYLVIFDNICKLYIENPTYKI
jgi:hypothetical protein